MNREPEYLVEEVSSSAQPQALNDLATIILLGGRQYFAFIAFSNIIVEIYRHPPTNSGTYDKERNDVTINLYSRDFEQSLIATALSDKYVNQVHAFLEDVFGRKIDSSDLERELKRIFQTYIQSLLEIQTTFALSRKDTSYKYTYYTHFFKDLFTEVPGLIHEALKVKIETFSHEVIHQKVHFFSPDAHPTLSDEESKIHSLALASKSVEAIINVGDRTKGIFMTHLPHFTSYLLAANEAMNSAILSEIPDKVTRRKVAMIYFFHGISEVLAIVGTLRIFDSSKITGKYTHLLYNYALDPKILMHRDLIYRFYGCTIADNSYELQKLFIYASSLMNEEAFEEYIHRTKLADLIY